MSGYLTVPNWEKHQHRDLANKGDMPWFKLDAGIFDDPAICDLGFAQFRAYIRALTLAAKTGNQLPARIGWLNAVFGKNWRRILTALIDADLLVGELPPAYGRGGGLVLTECSPSAQSGAGLSTRRALSEHSKTAQAGETSENTAPAPGLEERREDTDLSNALGGSPTGPPKQATPRRASGNGAAAIAAIRARAEAEIAKAQPQVADELRAHRERRASSFAQVVEEAANSP